MPPEVLIARARAIEAWLPRGLFLVHLGATIRFDESLHPRVTLPHTANLEHALGDIHGGVLATLVDAAAWCAAAVHYESWITTVELQVRLLEPAHSEDLVATGEVVRIGNRIAVASAEVRTAAGRLVATGGATFSVTSLPID
ncbi:MAG TPA: PaaI family thioesterase [Acidimicrobiia bacterium]|nr:PaaI family thioesterase [Acidimicrobiia bacterium]